METRPINEWIPRYANDWDYAVYPRGSVYKAFSRDPTYKNQRESDLHTTINNALTERASVGAKILFAFSGQETLDGTIEVPTGDNQVNFDFVGLGDKNSFLAVGDSITQAMIRCNRSSWNASANPTVGVRNLGFLGGSAVDRVIEMPFTYMKLKNLNIRGALGDGDRVVSGGGSGGGTTPVYVKDCDIWWNGYDRDVIAYDLWYDSCIMYNNTISCLCSNAGQVLIQLDGERYDIRGLSFFIDENATLGYLLDFNSVNAILDSVDVIAHSGGGQTVAGLLDSNGGSVIHLGRIRDGVPMTAFFKDSTTKQDVKPTQTLSFAVVGTLAADTDVSPTIEVPWDCWILGVRLVCKTAPTGASIIVDVNQGGTTIFTTQGNRPAIAATATSGSSYDADVVDLDRGDAITIDVDQVGSGDAGEDLTVELLTVAK